MSTKMIDNIYLELDLLINLLEKELYILSVGEVEKILKNRYIFMQEDIFYDSYTSSCWPYFEKFQIPSSCIGDRNCGNAIKNKYPKIVKWEIPTGVEITNTIKNTSIGVRGNCGRLKDLSGEIRYVLTEENNFFCLDNDLNWGIKVNSGHIIPIFRLNGKNGVKCSTEKSLTLWLNNGLIPTNLKNNKNYIELIEICRKYKLENLKFNRKEIFEDYKNKKLNIVFNLETEDFIEELLTSDKRRADILEYPIRILEDINEGHWDLWETELKRPIKVNLNKSLVARNPEVSIVDGVVGIDFGTKSTIVVYQKDSNYTLPVRVGIGDLSKGIKNSHYENPTIIEFININNFFKAYKSKEGRPETQIEDIVTSHNAFNNMIESPNANEFSSFFNELKKWAGTKGSQYKVIDKNSTILELKPFLELDDDSLDPIEIYAYYLGLHINNMHNGIYLDYYLSFPVTYEVEIRNKIRQSFYKGLKKSLPQALIENKEKIKEFVVNEGTSEPAAYAITALKEYKFYPEGDTKYFYGVFDFGGGTTDFDFGIWREAKGVKEKRFDYTIEHFGAGGDRYLGGENILELLSFEIFKLNSEKLREKNIQFILPPECREFSGAEFLLSKSREANLNMKLLMEKLRPFWECKDESSKKIKGDLKIDLWNVLGEKVTSFELVYTFEQLENIIKKRIEIGVKNFFESIRRAFVNANLDIGEIDKINIFLAGNSSKSIYLKDIFNKYIEDETEKMKDSKIKINEEGVFKIFPPLGTEESYKMLEEMGINPKRDSLEAPTGKTGVAYGLLESRQGSKIKVINHNIKEDITFRYYLGEERKNKFKVLIDRETIYNEWVEFIDASEKTFEIFYSEHPTASTNNMLISDIAIRRERIKIDVINEDALIYIRKVSPTSIEYVVALENEIEKNKYLGKINKIELG